MSNQTRTINIELPPNYSASVRPETHTHHRVTANPPSQTQPEEETSLKTYHVIVFILLLLITIFVILSYQRLDSINDILKNFKKD